MRYPFPDYPEARSTQGVEIRVCDTSLGCNPRLAGIKHLNRLEQVLARSEWDDEAIVDGVMLDGDGHLIDCTMSNLFLMIEGVLYTPDLSSCGVEGVMRSAVIETAHQHNIPVDIAPLKQTMLEQAQEIFITNALIGIWPVTRCGDYRYPVGATTRQLQSALASQMEFSHA
jgi:4-amino-4-deoxychorismate lyase